MRHKISFSGLFFLVTFASAVEDQSIHLRAVLSGYKGYTSKLYDVLRKSTEDNLIVSPISLSTVMAMLQAGARGSTAESIRTAMDFPENEHLLHGGYAQLFQYLRSDENVTLEMANKIYPAQGYRLNPNFVTTPRDYYGSDTQPLDFSQARQASQAINSFVTHFTRNRIQHLVSENDVNGLTKLMLVSVMYLKGTWKYKFPKEETIRRDSHVSPDLVDMMHLHSDNGILHGILPGLSAKCVVLPYKGDRLSMLILLLERRYGLIEMEEKLKDYSIDKITEHLHAKGPVSLYMPKFKLRQKMHLRGPLMALGAGAIFNDNADFSGIPATSERRRSIQVSDVIQEAFIEVNEEGSEAAAATTFGNRNGGFSLYADHAFYVVVALNCDTNGRRQLVPLFTARVADPRV